MIPAPMREGETPYDRAFYDRQEAGSIRSAEVILPIVYRVLAPASVVDVGCGQGAWLAACAALGSTTLTGIDGSWVDATRLRHPGIRFVTADLGGEGPIPVEGRHDLCISVEVAEHLRPERAETFVDALCRASDVVLFSAAVPFQGGDAHVNERRASYWAGQFAERGYECLDIIRGAVWTDARVEWWYRQNALVLVRRGTPAAEAFRAAPRPTPPLDIVHPEAYEEKLAYLLPPTGKRGGRSMSQALRAALAAVAGIATAVLMIMLVERIGHGAYPVPVGLDVGDREAMRAFVMDLPTGAVLFVLAAWMAGTYLGGVVAGSVARRRPLLYAGIVAVAVLAGAITNLVMFPHPPWVLPAGIAGIALAAWLAARTVARGFERAAARAPTRDA